MDSKISEPVEQKQYQRLAMHEQKETDCILRNVTEPKRDL